MIITIDGPAGSGKSTAARGLASRLGIGYLDTGAMYRAAALAAMAALRARAEPRPANDQEGQPALAALVALAVQAAAGIRLEWLPGPQSARVFLDGRDVTEKIRSAEISALSSRLARDPGVRAVMVARQRQIGAELARLGGLVTEGRDQGSVVFPDAEVKFFLDASPSVRARRRYDEMRAAGQPAAFDDVLGEIIARDQADRTRKAGPLRVPDGAILLDTSELSIEQVVDRLAEQVRRKGSE